MNEQAVQKATGRTLEQWCSLIRDSGKAGAPHKQIADFLHQTHGVSFWWAQELTVEYERRAGRRVLGQTQDGLFQVGVSRTIEASAGAVWRLLQSPRGIGLITAAPGEHPALDPGASASGQTGLKSLEHLDGRSPGRVRVLTTTFQEGSHVRLRWQLPGWTSHSILQVRSTPKPGSRTLLSFHHEKLPSEGERRQMREHWQEAAEAVAGCFLPDGQR